MYVAQPAAEQSAAVEKYHHTWKVFSCGKNGEGSGHNLQTGPLGVFDIMKIKRFLVRCVDLWSCARLSVSSSPNFTVECSISYKMGYEFLNFKTNSSSPLVGTIHPV